jgi:hypothetical protein
MKGYGLGRERPAVWYRRQRRLLRRLRSRPINYPLNGATSYAEPNLVPINPTKRP